MILSGREITNDSWSLPCHISTQKPFSATLLVQWNLVPYLSLDRQHSLQPTAHLLSMSLEACHRPRMKQVILPEVTQKLTKATAGFVFALPSLFLQEPRHEVNPLNNHKIAKLRINYSTILRSFRQGSKDLKPADTRNRFTWLIMSVAQLLIFLTSWRKKNHCFSLAELLIQ